ncbi:MerR family transcriptional regulator [Brachybacterium halotolerans subsp. kimchii]|uniref:MerR family transcriptional regulator n=1 Tax=Brachybacterium halotolerans TaxID=2795215 RepID=UPI001E51642E|nr:MerR family transcriptional regulator [Brachybacterium halotolerans]UEJ82823.1 MerR family transcriptional regulator [Brachybacterium halotolerans subsp. kimchii]
MQEETGMLRIGELARSTGVSVRSLRYYESRGLLEAQRTGGGQRSYQGEAVDRVLLIQQLFAAGLSSADIAELLPCMRSGRTTAAMVERLERERARMEQQIEQLHAARDRLDGVLADARSRSATSAPTRG